MGDDFRQLFKDPEHAALYDAILAHNKALEKRVVSLERWRWMQAGMAVLATTGLGIALKFIAVTSVGWLKWVHWF